MYKLEEVNQASKVVILNQKRGQSKVFLNNSKGVFTVNGETIDVETLTNLLNEYGDNPKLKITIDFPKLIGVDTESIQPEDKQTTKFNNSIARIERLLKSTTNGNSKRHLQNKLQMLIQEQQKHLQERVEHAPLNK